jgi:predicted small secreted protein
MKKAFIAVAALSMSLVACTTTTGTSTSGNTSTAGSAVTIGTNIFKAAVDNQCRTELNSNNAWRAIALTMTAEQQTAMENKI